MATGRYNESTGTAQKIKVYAGGSNVNLITDGPGASLCARKVRFLADVSVTSIKNHLDVEQLAGALSQSDREEIECSISEINCNGAFMAFW